MRVGARGRVKGGRRIESQTGAASDPWRIQNWRDSSVAEMTNMPHRSWIASSRRSATSTEPYPCWRCARADARIGTSKMASDGCISTTAAATALPFGAYRTTFRPRANCARRLIASSSISTSRSTRSASGPPVSAPPRENVKWSEPGTGCEAPESASSGDAFAVFRLRRCGADDSSLSIFHV